MDKKKLLLSVVFGSLLSLILFLVFIQLILTDNVKTQLTKSYLAKLVKDKNLTLIDDKITGMNKYYSDLNLTGYYNYLNSVYHYSKDKYDCKFYSLNWALYLELHHRKYKFVNLDKHIFVVTYTNKGYIILDENNKIEMVNKQ